MYKLNIEKGVKTRYTAVIKKLYFRRLWLVVARQEVETKAEAKAVYRQIAAY